MEVENEVRNIINVIILFDSLPHTCTSYGNRFKVKPLRIISFIFIKEMFMRRCYENGVFFLSNIQVCIILS